VAQFGICRTLVERQKPPFSVSNNLRSVLVFLALIAVCVFAYWEVATFQNSLKWDALDCYFPWRFIVGESIQHRVFPFWNPYQHLGYPIHADMRSAYSPEAVLVGLLGGYDLLVLHFLFMFYIVAGGFGMFRLATVFVRSHLAAFTAAMAYVLSGFFVGHGQELFGIVAGCWIPWVLFYFLRFEDSLRWADLWKLAFFLFLLLTGGYQALSLILFYLMLLLGLFAFGKRSFFEGSIAVRSTVPKHLALGILVLSSLAVLIVTYVQVSPLVQRLGGMTLREAYFCSMTPQALISFIAPFSVAGNADFLGTDISMANIYVGTIMLALFLVGLFLRKDMRLTLIFLFGALCLLASLGPSTPVREFMFNHVPGMNLFRMSSFFSYFSQLALILVASFGFDRILQRPTNYRALIFSLMVVFLATAAVATITYFDKAAADGLSLQLLLEPATWLPDLPYHHRLFVHVCIQAVIIVCLILIVYAFKRKNLALGIPIVSFVLLEMLVSVRLNFPATVGDVTPPTETQSKLDRQPKGFPIPTLDESIALNGENKPDLRPLYHNTNIFAKTNSWDGFNSFRLDRYENYTENNRETYLQDRRNPIVFATDKTATIEIVDYEPDRIVCNVNSHSVTDFVLQQIHYPGWQAKVDGNLAEIGIFHDAFPSVRLPEGTHQVTFSYTNAPVKLGFAISYFVFLLIVGGCLFHVFHKRQSAGVSIGATVGVMAVCLAFLGFQWSRTESMADIRVRNYQELATKLKSGIGSGSAIFLQVEKPQLMDSILQSEGLTLNVNYIDTRTQKGEAKFLRAFRQLGTPENVIYAGSILPRNRTVTEILRMSNPHVSAQEFDRSFILKFDSSTDRKPVYQSANEFELPNEAWNYGVHQTDTAAQTFSGKYGWRICSSQMGSPPLILRVGDHTSETRLKMLVGMKCLVPSERCSNANIYIVVERNGEKLWEDARSVNAASIDPETWSEMVFFTEPPTDIQPDDVIKVFVWGSEGEPFYLDDMWFAMYPPD